MTRVDRNTQILADAYCGADRTPNQSTKLNFDGLGSEILMNSAFIGVPALAAPITRPYWGALMEWKNNPLCTSYSQGLANAKLKQQAEKDILKLLTHDANGNKLSFADRYMNKTKYSHMNAMFKNMPNFDEPADITKLSAKKQAKLANKRLINEQLKEVKQLLDDVKKGKVPADKLNSQYKRILAKLRRADININNMRMNGTIKPTSMFGKATHALKKGTGYYNAKGFMLKSTKGFKFLKAAGKFGKMAGGFAAVGAIASEVGEVYGAKQIDNFERSQGRKSNRMKKQIGKSAVVATATAAGAWAASAAAGAAIGTAVCPLVGTVIGLAAGALGGLIGGWLGKKVTGKSEVEKYQEQQKAQANKQADELAKQASNDNGVKDEMLTALMQAKEAGQIDDKKIIALLEEEVKAREIEINENNELSEKLINLGNINYAA